MHAVDPNRAKHVGDSKRAGALIAYARCGVLWFATDDPELVTCARCRLEMVEAAIAAFGGKPPHVGGWPRGRVVEVSGKTTLANDFEDES